MSTFAGIPADAVAFYRELAGNNTKAWWAANKGRYDDHVREPLAQLLDELEDEFGPGAPYRPHRDIRFSKDKTPYKDHQGALVQAAAGIGWYVQVNATGLLTGAGYLAQGADQVERFRAAVDDDRTGMTVQAIIDGLVGAGWRVEGDTLKTRPRGVAPDHPRLDLLRHRNVIVLRDYGQPQWLATPEVADRVRADWRAVRPFVEWVAEHVGPTTQARR